MPFRCPKSAMSRPAVFNVIVSGHHRVILVWLPGISSCATGDPKCQKKKNKKLCLSDPLSGVPGGDTRLPSSIGGFGGSSVPDPGVIYWMLRNSASRPEIDLAGRILAGPLPGKYRNRPSDRPKAGRMADLGAFAVAVQPKSGPEV
jgi:hypothetical protein